MLLQRTNYTINIIRIFIDIIALIICWIFSFSLRFDSGIIAAPKGLDTITNSLRMLPIILFSYIVVFIITKTYGNEQFFNRQRVWNENISIIKNHIIAFFVFIAISFFIYEHRYSRIALGIFFIFAPIFLWISRSITRKIQRNFAKKKHNQKKVIIIGNGPNVNKVMESILGRTELGLKLVGTHSFNETEHIQKQLITDSVDLAFLIPGADETQLINKIYSYLDKTIVETIVVPYFGENVIFDPKAIKIDSTTMIALNTSNFNQYNVILKRIFDITFSLLFIVLFSPVYLACALMVKLSSKGPIFYKQERMGLDGKKFLCIKYRGMYTDAETKSGPVWATSNDNRTTPIGKWLRKTSLDEIPQFFNVLKGEMSIVGPRPERPFFVENFKTQIPGYMLRHKVKAGITGWAQINGWRGNTSLEKRIECDLWYIQNWSLWLDVKIVILTPLKGLIHPNAY